MRNNALIDRRTCLKGFGASLALPLLETMGWAEAVRGKSVKPPVRIGFMYMPHGVIMDEFWPTNAESFLKSPPPALESLRPILDQILLMPQTHKENQEGLNEGYYSHCSYRSPTQAVPAETNPRNVLNRLFGKSDKPGKAGQTDPLDRQMLDLVIGGAKDLRKKLPQGDQHKLDEYLDSVRAVERRIAAIEYRQKEAALEKAGVASSKRNASDSPPIEINIPVGDKRSEYMQVMCDLNVLAFQTDTTRVSSYIGSTPNGVSYPELGFTDTHHSQTHHNNEAGKSGKVAAITKFNIDQFAYMVKKMASLREHDVGQRPGGRQQTLPREFALHSRRQRRRLREHGTLLRQHQGQSR